MRLQKSTAGGQSDGKAMVTAHTVNGDYDATGHTCGYRDRL
jgi:hypothetical protein